MPTVGYPLRGLSPLRDCLYAALHTASSEATTCHATLIETERPTVAELAPGAEP
jgi:hypothetical protein